MVPILEPKAVPKCGPFRFLNWGADSVPKYGTDFGSKRGTDTSSKLEEGGQKNTHLCRFFVLSGAKFQMLTIRLNICMFEKKKHVYTRLHPTCLHTLAKFGKVV